MGKVSEGTKIERFQFIKRQRSYFGVRYLCHRLNVSSSGFYKWLQCGPNTRDQLNRQLTKKIITLYQKNKGNYGSPRIHATLQRNGERVNHKRVARIMREEGLIGKAGRLYRRKALSINTCISKPNIQREQGAPNRLNQQWAGDVTYLKVQGDWLYLSVVMDLYSRRIIGWSLGRQRTAQLTVSALEKSLKSRLVMSDIIFHSDRGSEYGAHDYQNQLKAAGIQASMNRPNCMNDNVYVESFFQSLKTECYHGECFDSEEGLRKRLSWYIDDYYNHQRLHSSLGFKTPVEFEALAV